MSTNRVEAAEEYINIIDDPYLVPFGYIQSKWVAEQLLQVANAETGLQSTVVRVGQLTGSINGAWDTNQWVPAMVKSALYLGCLPDGDDVCLIIKL